MRKLRTGTIPQSLREMHEQTGAGLAARVGAVGRQTTDGPLNLRVDRFYGMPGSEMKNAFITGTSSGLGRALAVRLREPGWQVYGCSRRGCDLVGVHDRRLDLTDYANVPAALEQLLAGVTSIDLVVLNAGVLGEIRDLSETPLDRVKQVMETNVWANKVEMGFSSSTIRMRLRSDSQSPCLISDSSGCRGVETPRCTGCTRRGSRLPRSS